MKSLTPPLRVTLRSRKPQAPEIEFHTWLIVRSRISLDLVDLFRKMQVTWQLGYQNMSGTIMFEIAMIEAFAVGGTVETEHGSG